jgi:branched-chain amino acid transport system ATP-binding protein/urea transport system ATP-binding protein
MLLDEPTEGIQPSIIEEIAETLKTLNQKLRLSLIVVEQNLEFLTSLSGTMLQMQKGRIAGEVAPEALLSETTARPATPSSGPQLRLAVSS